MLMIESAAAAVRFSAGKFDPTPRHFSSPAAFFYPGNKYKRLSDNSCGRSCGRLREGTRASAKQQSNSSLGSGPVKQNAKPQRYHPFEEIAESELNDNGEARLTPAETTRTTIEVNSKAMLMFSGLINVEVHENISGRICLMFLMSMEVGWCIYFHVKNDEDILQTLSSEEKLVQVIIGLDIAEIISEIESLEQTEIDFAIDEFDNEDSDVDDDNDDEDGEDGSYGKDWVAIVDNEEDQDEKSDGSLGDWAKLETMRSSHPMYFAKKLAEVTSDDPIDFLDQPPAGLAIQGLLRPPFVEEHAVIQKHISDDQTSNGDANQTMTVEGLKEEDLIQIDGLKHETGSAKEGPGWVDELEKDETPGNGTSFYKLEMVKIQLISAHGQEIFVEVEDFRRAQPEGIAHSAGKIIARIKAGGEKTTKSP